MTNPNKNPKREYLTKSHGRRKKPLSCLKRWTKAELISWIEERLRQDREAKEVAKKVASQKAEELNQEVAALPSQMIKAAIDAMVVREETIEQGEGYTITSSIPTLTPLGKDLLKILHEVEKNDPISK